MSVTAQDVPDHRAGRDPGRPAEHPDGLPVRHRLQADLPRGPGRRGAGHLPAGRPDAAGGAGRTARPRTRPHTCDVPSVLLTPKWVTTANMASTVIKDKLRPGQPSCARRVAAACTGGRHQLVDLERARGPAARTADSVTTPAAGDGARPADRGPGAVRRRRAGRTPGRRDAPLLSCAASARASAPVQALIDIDLDVPAGQVTALVGDNGPASRC